MNTRQKRHKLSPQQKFVKRLKEIDGLNNKTTSKNRKPPVDIRHEEFRAMTDAFLGKNYNQEKLREIENQQIIFDKKHSELVKRFYNEEINLKEYAVLAQYASDKLFKAINTILGSKEFRRLFGITLKEVIRQTSEMSYLWHNVEGGYQTNIK